MTGEAIGTTARALASRLRELAQVVSTLDQEAYRWRHPAGVSGSVGAHVRHCLDHVEAVLSWRGEKPLCYDARRRETDVEVDHIIGHRRLLEAAAALDAEVPADGALALALQVTREGDVVTVPSSVGREMAFALQHTIHHQAVLAVLLASRAEPVPDGFGLAPVTPLPTDRPCAR